MHEDDPKMDDREALSWSKSGLSRFEVVHGRPPDCRVRISWEGSREKAQMIVDYIISIDAVIDGSISGDHVWKR